MLIKNPEERISFPPYGVTKESKDGYVIQDEHTLLDIVFGHYVFGSAVWSLGYKYQMNRSLNEIFAEQVEARNEPLRAQTHESPFETAWSILLLLNTLDVGKTVIDAQYGSENLTEERRRAMENLNGGIQQLKNEMSRKVPWAVKYLVTEGKKSKEREREKGNSRPLTNWDDWYDTAIILHSLVWARTTGFVDPKDNLTPSIIESLVWMREKIFDLTFNHYRFSQSVIDDLTIHGGESLAVTFTMMLFLWQNARSEFTKVFGGLKKPEYRKSFLHPVLSFMLKQIIVFIDQKEVEMKDRSQFLPARPRMLVDLSLVLIRHNKKELRLSREIKNKLNPLLLDCPETLVYLDLHEKIKPDTAERADRLTIYAAALRAIGNRKLERLHWILGQLRSLTHTVDPFWDGSTYHSLYATRHTFETFLEVSCWCVWFYEKDQKKILDMYDEMLKAPSLHAFEVERQTYDLQRQLLEIKEQLKSWQSRGNNYRFAFFTLLVFLILTAFFVFALPLLDIGKLTINPGNEGNLIALFGLLFAASSFFVYIVSALLGRSE